MAYFNILQIKDDLSIKNNTDDARIINWGAIADSQVDDMLYEIASKNRKIDALPVLPLSSPPSSIVGAANDMVKRKYKLYVKNYEGAKQHEEDATKAVTGFINRLKVDRETYGRILH